MFDKFFDRLFIANVFILVIACMQSAWSVDCVWSQDPLWGGYRAESDVHFNSTEMAGFWDVSDGGVERFFLLKTGLLLQATATIGETHYEIKSQYGTMQVPKENVEHVAETREEIYRYKKTLVDPASCTQQINLAEWCFNNGLKTQSLEEFGNALKAAPNDNLADFVRQRMSTVETSVRQRAELPNPETSTESSDPDLQRWINGVPQSVFDLFSKKVQPILVQRCASAECHGSSGDNQYQINIPRQPGGRTTYINLRSTISWIDMENPSASSVLSALVTSHAGKRAPFTIESDQYNNFIEWIQLTAKELPTELNEPLLARIEKEKGVRRQAVSISKPVKADVLPKTYRESLSVGQSGAAAENAMSRRSQNSGVFSPLISSPPGSDNIMKATDYMPTRLAVPNATIRENDREEDPNRPAVSSTPLVDPYDPECFNTKYHADLQKIRLR